jgi:hypothetical protein
MVVSSIKNDEPIKTIRIRTIIPFSFPFSFKKTNLPIVDKKIDVDFKTVKRIDIIKQLFPQFPFDFYINKRKLPNNQAEISRWMHNDRFGQLNYMFAIFYFYATEKNKDDIKKAMDKKYLPLCADAINYISTGYRLLTNEYFPRNFTKNEETKERN